MEAFGGPIGIVSVAALLICGGAYCYGYLYRPPAFRPLHVASLCFTGLAILQLLLSLQDSVGRLNALYAMAFLVLSGLAQAVIAVRGRSGRRPRSPDEVR